MDTDNGPPPRHVAPPEGGGRDFLSLAVRGRDRILSLLLLLLVTRGGIKTISMASKLASLHHPSEEGTATEGTISTKRVRRVVRVLVHSWKKDFRQPAAAVAARVKLNFE